MVNKKAVCTALAREAGLPLERFPKTEEEIARAEDAFANELANLSLEEQEKALFDVHGISHVELEEDPQMIEEALQKLEEAIQKIEKKDAYEEAKFLNDAYVSSRNFRMMFLRGENFDVEVAARTIVYHFEFKKELFGNGEILAREVLQSDLNDYDRMIVDSGMVQVCSKHDACGRTIQLIFCDGPAEKYDVGTVLRAWWYMSMSVLRDEEVQKRGIVWILYSYTNFVMELDFFKEYNRLDIAVPLRAAAGHWCYQSDAHDAQAAQAVGYKMFSHKDERTRIKIHKGTHSEITFKLQTYGIPAEEVPIREDGTWSRQWHSEWIKALRVQEEKHSPVLSNVLIPKKEDVLFGKNARARDHVGNMRAHRLVEKYYDEYEAADKFEKTDIANRIIDEIKENSGRFLKQDELCVWTIVEDKVARQKIAHWYRHLRHKMSKQPEKEKEASSVPKKRVVSIVSAETLDISVSIKRVTPCPSPVIPLHRNIQLNTEETQSMSSSNENTIQTC